MTHEIVVIGAGYAGLATAHRLARLLSRADARVTLVNSRDRFVERVRLHQIAVGQDLRTYPLVSLLRGADVRLVVATVTDIDPEARCVSTHDGAVIRYDTLVYALGSAADLDGAPGAAEHALAVADQSSTERLRGRVAALGDGGSLTVVGGGLTGIEMATELAETREDVRVRLVTDGTFGGWLSPAGERYLRRSVDRLGIEVVEDVRVLEVGPGRLVTDAGDLATDETVWSAGFCVPALAARAGLAVDDRGRLQVDASLRSLSHPDVYGIGDAAAATTTPGGANSRMSCQAGLPMGLQAGRIIANRVTGRPARASWVRYVWVNISLGRRDGLTQFSHADDTPRRQVLTGRPSARLKELITRGTLTELRHPWLIPDLPTAQVP